MNYSITKSIKLTLLQRIRLLFSNCLNITIHGCICETETERKRRQAFKKI